MISWKEDGYSYSKVCECQKVKAAEEKIRRSGLARAMKTQTFETFTVETDLQKRMKDMAEAYLKELLEGEDRPWMYIGGNPGAGKTHICTAVCGELLRAGKAVKYMQWVDEARRLKRMVNDEDFDELLSEYLDAEILYIDDLCKGRWGEFEPTDAEIRMAFSIFNGRYIRDLPTIVTSEWDLIEHLMGKETGTFSRVYEKTKKGEYVIYIGRNNANNYRLRKEQA